MLNVQQVLIESKLSVDDALKMLDEKFGVLSKKHPVDSRVILDYDQIRADKKDDVVRECRGLVLDTKDWSLVARGFRRFFNAGEVRQEDIKFNWDNEVVVTHKEDGSFFLLYFYDGLWRTNTRFSFAEHNISDFPFTWNELFKLGFNYELCDSLNKEYSYVFEVCSRYNKIVRDYQEPQVFLLSAFNGEIELNFHAVQSEAISLGVQTPVEESFDDISKVQAYIAKIAEEDHTFEGVVVRDVHNNRLKVKSDFYIRLHRLNNNGNITNIKNIIPLIVSGESEEVLIYFPELKNIVSSLESKINKIKDEIDNAWLCYHDESSQKKFALSIKKSTKHTGPLFEARKRGGHPFDYLDADYFVNCLKG